MHLHNILPRLKIAEDMIDFELHHNTTKAISGSESVTQDNTVLCESEGGHLCFGMSGGVKECAV